MGFELFQGYFFSKPKILQAKKLDIKHTSIIGLIDKLNSGVSIGEIEADFNNNPNLTVGLLKYINSSIINTKKEISTIPQAVNMLGRQPLIQWLTLNLYANTDEHPYKNSLLQTVMLRAELMASMARHYKLDKTRTDKAYLVGLVSLLHALLHIPLDAIFKDIPFDKEIEKAVLQRDGALGKLLKIVSVFEKGDFFKIKELLAKIKMCENQLSDIMSRAYINVMSKDASL
jgi:EAL and modified HD-GYP domain-containing signal transduction protein